MITLFIYILTTKILRSRISSISFQEIVKYRYSGKTNYLQMGAVIENEFEVLVPLLRTGALYLLGYDVWVMVSIHFNWAII